MIEIFFTVLVTVLVLGLIPSIVSEDTLHEWVSKIYLNDKSNLDKIYDELDKKNYLVQDFYISDCRNLANCNSIYYFVEPVKITFDIDSPYTDCQTFKEFNHINTFNLYALDGDIECQVVNGDKSKSVFLFKDTHKLKFKIESEDTTNELDKKD